MKPLPIEDILSACSFDYLQAEPTSEELEEVLSQLAARAAVEDAARRELLRAAALKRLRALKVSGAARLVDAFVKPAKGRSGGGQHVLADDEAHSEPVDGALLLADLMKHASRYLVVAPGALEALSLWIVHTYVFDYGATSPRLAVTSPEKRCGKTRVLEFLLATVRRPLPAANVSAAALYRVIAELRPTLVIDEADTFLRTAKGDNDEVRGLLNAGHGKGTAFVIRCDGEENKPKPFSVWAPVAIAMIGDLPDTLADRSVPIAMRRRQKGEAVERFRLDRARDELAGLRCRAVRWARDSEEDLRNADPQLPELLDDRAQDNWRPLVAIADLAGGDWPRRAREVACLLSAERDDGDESTGVLLLRDIQRAFEERGVDRLRSEELREYLHALEERPWPEYGRARKPISARQLACLLRPFKVRPATIKLPSGLAAKGYLREWFEDSFARYLPAPSVTSVTSGQDSGLRQLRPVTGSPRVTDGEPRKSLHDNEVTAVTDRDRGRREKTAGSAVSRACPAWVSAGPSESRTSR